MSMIYRKFGMFFTVLLTTLCSNWVYPQEAEVSSEFIYTIRAECPETEPSFGTGFISADKNAIVTSLHVVDGACTISAFKPDADNASDPSYRSFDDMCLERTSEDDDLALLWSTKLQRYIDSAAGIGYSTYTTEPTFGPAITFGYSQRSTKIFSRSMLRFNAKSVLDELIFEPDREKWIRCESPKLSNVYFRIEGIAISGDSGAPIFRQGDSRVFGVVSGGRALGNVVWAASLNDATFDNHTCPTQRAKKLQNDECTDLKYFYSKEEEEKAIVLLPPLNGSGSHNPSDEPKTSEWYRNWKVWAGLITATIAVSVLMNTDDDGGTNPQTLTLTIPVP